MVISIGDGLLRTNTGCTYLNLSSTLYIDLLKKTAIARKIKVHVRIYGTAQFKLDIHTRVLVQSLEKFLMELVSFSQVHNMWHAFDPHNELYTREVHSSVVYFTCEQLRYA